MDRMLEQHVVNSRIGNEWQRESDNSPLRRAHERVYLVRSKSTFRLELSVVPDAESTDPERSKKAKRLDVMA